MVAWGTEVDMDRASATAVVETVLQFASRINDSIRQLMLTGPSGPQLNEYRRAAGRVLGYLYTDILRPIFAQYPDLEPKSMKSGQAAPDEPIDRAVAEMITTLMYEVREWLARLPDAEKEAFAEGVAEVRSGIEDVRTFVAKSHADLAND
jgi:hypothetical protein